MSKKFVTIKIKEHLSSFISSRQAAELITEKSLKQLSDQNKEKVVLNFEEVEFTSRSFMDELLDSIEKFENRGIKVEINKANPSVSQMLEVVKNSRAQVK